MAQRNTFLKNFTFGKFVVFVNCLVPLALLLWDWTHDRVGADPLAFITNATGTLTLVFLLISLAVTPLRRLTGWNPVVKYRRMLGLYAFFYGLLHFMTYVVFDKFFDFREMVSDAFARPFIFVGLASFLLMVPLAVTSTNGMIKRLGGKRWNLLHKSVYLVAIGGVIHFFLIVKSDIDEPLKYGAVLAVLLGYRVAVKYFPGLTLKRQPMPSPIPRR